MSRKVKLLGTMGMWLAVMLAATATQTVTAAEPQTNQTSQADPARGETLFSVGLPERQVPACLSCHGSAGNSGTAANPTLAGQHAEYLVKQLTEFKAHNARNNPIMSTYSQALSDQDMRDIAAYLSRQSMKPSSAKNKDTILLGQKIYRAGIADKGVPACASCHGPRGAGIPTQYPRIGGQWADYTTAQLLSFRSGERKNNLPMQSISLKLSDLEIKAVSDYIAGLR